MAPIRRGRSYRPSSLLGSNFFDHGLMAVSTGDMSTNPPALSMACTGDRRGRGPDSEEDNLAFSLMMLSRGVREEPVGVLADVAAPPSPPQHLADVPATQERVLVLNQASSAPAVAAASQTPPSLAVFVPGQAAGQVLPSPVVAVEPSLVLEQVAPPSQAPAPVLATTQAPEHMAVVGSKRAAPKPKPTTKPRKAPKTVAAHAQRESQAPTKRASQATEQAASQAPEQVESQTSEHVASQAPEQVVPPSQAPAPVLATTQAREHMAVVGSKRAAPKPKPPTKPRKALKTVAAHAQRESQAPGQRKSQAPAKRASQATEQAASQAPEQVERQASEQVASQAPEQMVPPRQAPAPVLATTQAREHMAVVGSKRAAPKPKPTTKPQKALKTVAAHAQRESQAPGQRESQAPAKRASQATEQASSQAPEQVESQASEQVASQAPEQVATRSPEQGASQAPDQAASQALLHKCVVCHKMFNRSRSMVLVLNQASSTPAVTAATRTPSSLGVFAPGQAAGQVVLQQVVLPSQATAPVLATTQARQHTAVVGPKRAAPNPKPTTKPRMMPKTVAAQAQRASQAPEQAASQELLYECHVCHKAFDNSRGLNHHMNCHPDGRLHPCVYCMSTFPSSSALRSHVRRSNTCGGKNRRRLVPVAAAALAFHTIDLNMPEI